MHRFRPIGPFCVVPAGLFLKPDQIRPFLPDQPRARYAVGRKYICNPEKRIGAKGWLQR